MVGASLTNWTPRHVDLLIAAGLDNPSPKGVTTPAINDVSYENEERVSRKEAFGFRSTCVRVSFLAVDLRHWLYGCKKAAWLMQHPTLGTAVRITRVARCCYRDLDVFNIFQCDSK